MSTRNRSQFVGLDGKPYGIKCLLCECTFVLPTNEANFHKHLFDAHRLIIGDAPKIASLTSYIHYWGVKFREIGENALKIYCSKLFMNGTPDDQSSENKHHYMLSEYLSEDKILRSEIYQAKKTWVLAQHETERRDKSFKRDCMFCRTEFCGSRIAYMKHLLLKHNFYFGKLEDLVFIDELLDKVENNIESLICIYCEKIFKDRTILKEHMRKKFHKTINSHNKMYDKFYINNYFKKSETIWEQGQIVKIQNLNSKKNLDLKDNNSESEDEENSWSDWDDEPIEIICLLCSYSNKEIACILKHMKEAHNFDFKKSVKNFSFYQKIKVVNYIKRQIELKLCIFCETSTENVLEHMKKHQHCKIPEDKVWNQPQYYFPRSESDSFLYNLDAFGNSDEEDDVENITGAMSNL